MDGAFVMLYRTRALMFQRSAFCFLHSAIVPSRFPHTNPRNRTREIHKSVVLLRHIETFGRVAPRRGQAVGGVPRSRSPQESRPKTVARRPSSVHCPVNQLH